MNCRKKLGLLVFTVFTALAYHAVASEAVAVVGGRQLSAEEAGGAAAGYDEGRGLAEHAVSTTTEAIQQSLQDRAADKMANGERGDFERSGECKVLLRNVARPKIPDDGMDTRGSFSTAARAPFGARNDERFARLLDGEF